eukprot:TRINITY_DN11447_c0_g1_i1.p1 TRINITY_DN11447_c0_g1~~TRINITY_DN11447_c0_g1_i1.p1  ORF type:complete len:132 (+),score=30.19 TRINITY_DN11447_c0_g1_i1:92-487(+)
MIRRPPRSTLSSSSAASDVYKRQIQNSVASLQEGHCHTGSLTCTESDRTGLKLIQDTLDSRWILMSKDECDVRHFRGRFTSHRELFGLGFGQVRHLSLIHISEPTRLLSISYAVFCLKKKKKKKKDKKEEN